MSRQMSAIYLSEARQNCGSIVISEERLYKGLLKAYFFGACRRLNNVDFDNILKERHDCHVRKQSAIDWNGCVGGLILNMSQVLLRGFLYVVQSCLF